MLSASSICEIKERARASRECPHRGMHAQEGGCLNIVPSTLYQQAHIYFFSPRAQFAAVLYCDERQMSKSRESAQEREREKKKTQSVSLDGQPTMDDNDSKRLRRFSLKKYLFSRPSLS
jgi:hypothetical protein